MPASPSDHASSGSRGADGAAPAARPILLGVGQQAEVPGLVGQDGTAGGFQAAGDAVVEVGRAVQHIGAGLGPSERKGHIRVDNGACRLAQLTGVERQIVEKDALTIDSLQFFSLIGDSLVCATTGSARAEVERIGARQSMNGKGCWRRQRVRRAAVA